MGTLIIIEGSDGSGKQTQTELIYEKLCEKYSPDEVKKISFPNYEGRGSELVKMYLEGAFGKDANNINAYSSSIFFSADRYASYKTEWENFYKNGGIVISDRYTTSNMIHQLSKIEDEKEREEYLNWLVDLEWNKMGLPKPTAVFFLDMPYECSQKLIRNRNNKITGENEKDIHESNQEYLRKSYETAKEVAKNQNWIIIPCIDEKSGAIKSIEEINSNIMEELRKL